MARLKKPLFGDSATGSIGRSISYIRSPGFPSCRHKYYHKTTHTEGQVNQRSLFFTAKEAWKALMPSEKSAWNKYATPPLNGYNTFLHYYLSGLPFPSFPIYISRAIQNPVIMDLTPNVITVTLSSILYEKEDVITIMLENPTISIVPHIQVSSPVISISLSEA